MTQRPQSSPPASTGGWLPDFCALPTLAAVLVAVQVIVFVIALAPGAGPPALGKQLLALSAFAQWLALLSAVCLCVLRPRLGRLPVLLSVAIAWLLPCLVAMAGSVLLYELDRALGLDFALQWPTRVRFVAGVTGITALVTATLLRYFYVQQQWHRQVEARARSNFEALQARIRPHFLFNSMNMIASLVRRDPDTAVTAIEDLSELFRAALGADSRPWTFGDELDLTRRFLAIEALRLGDRLTVDWQTAPDLPLGESFPRLILQPLAENAIVHGVARLREGGTVRIQAETRSSRLEITVGNPQPVQSPRVSAPPGNRHAQDSIEQRLKFHFGPSARMTGQSAEGYYSVMLSLPLAP